MSVIVRLPSQLRALVGGAAEVPVEATTVREAIVAVVSAAMLPVLNDATCSVVRLATWAVVSAAIWPVVSPPSVRSVWRARVRPMPTPTDFFVLTKGSKAVSRTSGEMPWPLSIT